MVSMENGWSVKSNDVEAVDWPICVGTEPPHIAVDLILSALIALNE